MDTNLLWQLPLLAFLLCVALAFGLSLIGAMTLNYRRDGRSTLAFAEQVRRARLKRERTRP